jgi:formamidopyrimidine-DNA glycosylase
MPELPEVETIRRQLAERLDGSTIEAIELWKTGREEPHGPLFVQALVGKTIERVERRAKVLIWRFTDGDAVVAHLKMTGKFLFADQYFVQTKHDRARFVFRDGVHLVWSDVRQFGYMKYLTQNELAAIWDAYGPEPLESTPETLAERLKTTSKRPMKAMLLDQKVIAGIGNIYADEACHRAGIRPARKASALTSRERTRLAMEIQEVLQESLAQRGTSANDYVDTEGNRGGFLGLLRVYGRKGERCRTCGTPIQKIVLAQRGTHFCPTCQR